MSVSFNKPYHSEKEIENIIDSFERGKTSGDGYYTKLCNEWFLKNTGKKILLTHSCTAALEMTAVLMDAQAGDEVIMPSYTFVSTANAYVLRGLKPVFVDIRPDTLNIDENLIEGAVTKRTRAIVPVHYAGIGCEMDRITSIARKHGLYVFEDAAQGFGSRYNGKPLGTIGDLGAYSFHETKNIISGEGGCLIVNNEKFAGRAEIIREKGTNRPRFLRGEIDKYTWVDVGSSYLPSDIIAACLYAQLECSERICAKRMELWNTYHAFFEEYEKKGIVRRPAIPRGCEHNAHTYYILFNDLTARTNFIDYLRRNDISSVFHYVPLHSSPAGQRFGRTASKMDVTDRVSDTLARLPLFYELDGEKTGRVLGAARGFFGSQRC